MIRKSTNVSPADDRSYVAELATRLRRAVEHGGGLPAVSNRTGLSQRTMENWLAGQDVKGAALRTIAKSTGVAPGWLLAGEGSMLPEAPNDALTTHPASPVNRNTGDAPNGYAILPRYNVQASAGEGALISSEQVVEFLAFHKDWLRDNIRRSPDKLLLIEARGDSMSPTIRDRDLLIVDTTENGIADGAIHVVRMGEALVVKRLELRIDGSVVVHSDNPRYGPVPVTASDAEGIHIIGQVVWQGGPVRS